MVRLIRRCTEPEQYLFLQHTGDSFSSLRGYSYVTRNGIFMYRERICVYT